MAQRSRLHVVHSAFLKMTYSVDVEFDSVDELQEAFAWLHGVGLKHIVDWRWFRHGAVGNYTRCTFQFDDARYSDLFTLRWL